MNDEDYENAAGFWQRWDAKSRRMDERRVREEMSKYLREHNTCALAVSGDGEIRNPPVEYWFAEGAVWVFSEGGRKFACMRASDRAAVSVYDPYGGPGGKLAGMELIGRISILDPGTEEYLRVVRARGVDPARLSRERMKIHLLKFVPERIEYLNNAFRAENFDARQTLDLEGREPLERRRGAAMCQMFIC